MKLAQLLEGVPVTKMFQTMYGQMIVTHDAEIRSIQYDSRKVGASDCFVALRGTSSDGHAFLMQAIDRGARVVVVEREDALPDALSMHAGVVKVVVEDTRKALAVMSSNYYGRPTKAMKLVGVTGTNGKTTTTHLVKSVLEASGEKVGLIGTIEYALGNAVVPATHTTPESLELNGLFAQMRSQGCASVSMEVSSHALTQQRVYGLDFAVAVFTNLTQDHLDYHGSMDNYFAAKKTLFDGLNARATAVTNADDARGTAMVSTTRATRISYGLTNPSDVTAREVALSISGTQAVVEYHGERTSISSPLVGRFNVSNMLAGYAVGMALGIPVRQVRDGIERLRTVAGRFERIPSARGWTAIVDYAHTPDALAQTLRTLREVLPRDGHARIISVFGAGGDRDKTKRPEMGRIVSDLSDITIVTSDNPRTEDPERIIDDIMKGVVVGRSVQRDPDRKRAIEKGIEKAQPGDVVLIAGKGHEDYQVIGREKKHFSDREIVMSLV